VFLHYVLFLIPPCREYLSILTTARLLLMGKFIVCTSQKIEITKLPSGLSWSINLTLTLPIVLCSRIALSPLQVYNGPLRGIVLLTNLTDIYPATRQTAWPICR